VIKHELKIGSTTYIFYGTKDDQASLDRWRRETISQGYIFGVKYGPLEAGNVCTEPMCQRWEGLMAIAPILVENEQGLSICSACGTPASKTN